MTLSQWFVVGVLYASIQMWVADCAHVQAVQKASLGVRLLVYALAGLAFVLFGFLWNSGW